MREFRYLAPGTDILTAVLPGVQTDTWLIFPTERSCREAMQAFQQNWQPLNIAFLSMDEFKQKVIYSDRICLQDEKRLLCLYQAMSPEDKSDFHIEKYPDLIEWGQHFFGFFEELAEECVDGNDLLNRMSDNEFSYLEWQFDNFGKMLAICQKYHNFISEKDYSDVIFDRNIANLHLPAGIKHYVFVNQFYYTGLEKAIIAKIEERKCRTVIYYQGCKEWFDEANLISGEFVPEDAFPSPELPFSLQVYQSSDLWQMALSFLDNYRKNQQIGSAALECCSTTPQATGKSHYIIDAKFLQQPYHKVFTKELFGYSEPVPLHGTRLCHFLQIVSTGLQGMLSDNGRLLVKLDWLLQAIGMYGFMEYFRPQWKEQQKDLFTTFVCKFSEQDVLYLDLKLEILKLKPFTKADADCAALLKDILELLNRLSGVASVKDLIACIDADDGIVVEKLLAEEERESSNLREKFYEGLANFSSIDELALVNDWQELYPQMPISAGIFDLFIAFIKPKTFKFWFEEAAAPSASITNLMDTRNLQAEKVTFLNLTEDELPSGRTPVWLFNERQRKAIGLKTWDDIRNWERHYFYRIIASAKEVEIYTIANQDQDIESSSFLNELFLFALQKKTVNRATWQISELPADTLLLNWLNEDSKNPLSKEADIEYVRLGSFFNLPCDRQSDFGDKQVISLSWSACEHFIRNPFLYYLKDVKKLSEKTVRQEETLSRKMFGTLLHHYLNAITTRLAGQHEGILSMKWEWINGKFLADNLRSALADPLLFYQIPKNYNQEYLQELLSPFLIDTAGWLFHVGLAKEQDFQNEIIKLIPETAMMTDKELQYRTLIKPEDNEYGLAINIRGRADLRLETGRKKFIIDFKTGESDWLQLMFYMWFYYLIDNPELQESVRAAFYKLLDKQMNWFDHKSKSDPAQLKEKLLESLKGTVESGFAPAADAKHRRYFIDITRADLLRNLAPEEEEE